MLHAHPYYGRFADYGDAEGYQRDLGRLREALQALVARQED